MIDDKTLDDMQKKVEKELAVYSEYKISQTKVESFCWIAVELVQALRQERKDNKAMIDVLEYVAFYDIDIDLTPEECRPSINKARAILKKVKV